MVIHSGRDAPKEDFPDGTAAFDTSFFLSFPFLLIGHSSCKHYSYRAPFTQHIGNVSLYRYAGTLLNYFSMVSLPKVRLVDYI